MSGLHGNFGGCAKERANLVLELTAVPLLSGSLLPSRFFRRLLSLLPEPPQRFSLPLPALLLPAGLLLGARASASVRGLPIPINDSFCLVDVQAHPIWQAANGKFNLENQGLPRGKIRGTLFVRVGTDWSSSVSGYCCITTPSKTAHLLFRKHSAQII